MGWYCDIGREDTTQNPRRKKKDKVDEYITLWKNRLDIPSSNKQQVNTNSTLEFPSFNKDTNSISHLSSKRQITSKSDNY